jgi:hypothetical protein
MEAKRDTLQIFWLFAIWFIFLISLLVTKLSDQSLPSQSLSKITTAVSKTRS